MNFIYCTEGHMKACQGDWTQAVLLGLLMRQQPGEEKPKAQQLTPGEIKERLCGALDERMIQRALFGLERMGFVDVKHPREDAKQRVLRIVVRQQAEQAVREGTSEKQEPDWKTLWRN